MDFFWNFFIGGIFILNDPGSNIEFYLAVKYT